MINKHIFFLLINVFVFSYAQTIKIEGKQLIIGMEKTEALDIMHEFLGHVDYDSLSDNFWLKSENEIIGTMGFQDEKLSYVTTDWDKNIDYLDSIELFNLNDVYIDFEELKYQLGMSKQPSRMSFS